MSNKRAALLICILLTIAVFAVFWRTLGHGFVNYDDDAYVAENLHVRTGLTLPNVEWALSAMRASNWHPVTWISHMLDCALYGTKPRGHHLTNLLLHLANVLLLFGLLRRMTGSTWRSGFVAALFAVHPLHVESVAWIAERKDLLGALFWLLAMWAYARYAERPSPVRYLAVAVAFFLGLMSKPMIVTLPFVLLLLDYWPLGRFNSQLSTSNAPSTVHHAPGTSLGTLVREKIPLFLMSVAGCAVTYTAQNAGMTVGSLDRLPFGERIANAAVAYVAYIGKMVYPTRLSVFYPHPKDMLPVVYVIGAWLALAVVTFAVLRLRNRPYLFVGWLWFLGTLVPVIGLMQVGWQSMADRYTYMPLVGLFMMIAWATGPPSPVVGRGRRFAGRTASPTGVCNTLKGAGGESSSGHTKPTTHGRVYSSTALIAVAIVLLVALGITACHQVSYWRDSTTLFTRALDVTRNNPVAENNLAMALAVQGKTDAAIVHHHRALEIEPEWADAHYNLGSTLFLAGRTDEAIREFRAALRIYPGYARALNNLGAALMDQGKALEAEGCFMKALEINPDYPRAYMNLGTALSEQGRMKEAMAAYRMAVQLDPTMPDAHHNLAITLLQTGRRTSAIAECREALRLKPDWSDAENNLAYMLSTKPGATTNEIDEAVRRAESACRSTNYRNPNYLDTLTTAYSHAGRYQDAAVTARKAAEIARASGRPDLAKRLSALARMYESQPR